MTKLNIEAEIAVIRQRLDSHIEQDGEWHKDIRREMLERFDHLDKLLNLYIGAQRDDLVSFRTAHQKTHDEQWQWHGGVHKTEEKERQEERTRFYVAVGVISTLVAGVTTALVSKLIAGPLVFTPGVVAGVGAALAATMVWGRSGYYRARLRGALRW